MTGKHRQDTDLYIGRDTIDPAGEVARVGATTVFVTSGREGLLEELIPASRGIRRIDVRCDMDVSALSSFASLERLWLQGGIDGVDFSKLSRLRLLGVGGKYVDTDRIAAAPILTRLEITDGGLKNLESFVALQRLEELSISESPLQSLTGIDALPALRSLEIHKAPLRSLDAISTAPGLHSIILGFLTTLESIAPLAALPRLRELALTGLRKVKDFEVIGSIATLEWLSIVQCPLTALDFLSGHSGLRELRLINLKSVPSFRVVETLPALVHFTASDTIADDGDVAFLRRHPSLREIHFSEKRHYNSRLTTIQEALGREVR